MDSSKQVAKLHKTIAKHYREWVVSPVMIESFRDDPFNLFQAILDGEKRRAAIAGASSDRCRWHFSQYANAVHDEGQYPFEEFALSARYAHATVNFEEAFANAGKNGTLIIEYAAFFLSLNIIAGWKAEAASVGLSIYRGLDTTLLDLRRTPEHAAGTLYRHFWFLLELYCQARGLPLDTSLYSYPADMSPYSAVLADWRTTDLDKVQGFVSAMADFHLQQARFTKHDEIAEFDTEDRMLFPHEILSFLRFREWVGLSNPITFDHPLMQHPMARMPTQMPLPYPDTPLLDAVVLKFQEEYPDSFKA